MPFNSGGVFSRLYNWVTDAGNTIPMTAARFDADANDMAAGLSQCLTRNGQSAPIANLPMGGFKLTGLLAGSAAGDSVSYDQLTNANGSTILGYIAPGTGAVSRTTSDKLAENVSSKDFGTLGNYNGTSGFDDTPKLQAHVTYAAGTTNTGTYGSYSPAAGSGVVTVPQGSYQVSTAVSVTSKVSIEGDGQPEYSYGSRITLTNANSDLFQISASAGSTSFSMERMVLRANTAAGTGNLVNMVRSGGGTVNSQRYISNTFAQPPAFSLKLAGDDIVIKSNLFDVSQQSGDCIQLGTSTMAATNVRAEGNDFFNSTRSCFKLVNVIGLTVNGNTMTQPNTTTRTPYFIDGKTTSPVAIQDVTISGNTIRGPRTFVGLVGSANVTINGNTVAEGGIGTGESQNMIDLSGGNVNVSMVGNTLRGAYDTKHFYDDSGATSVTGVIALNTFQNDAGAGDALSCTKFAGRILSNFYAGFTTQQMGEKRATTGQPVTPGTLTAFGTGGALYAYAVTVAGATFGDKVDFGTISNSWIVPNGVVVIAFVSAANTARIEYRNMTPGSIAVPAHDIWTEVTR